MSQNITIREIGDQFIMSNGEYLINKSKISDYITLITDKPCPEKVLLGIEENGYYMISYCETDGIIYNMTDKPESKSRDVKLKS
tara:strand:+ start:499 stop:750 length:252 start_codon:yes stop_codon:yes gene_type:complete